MGRECGARRSLRSRSVSGPKGGTYRVIDAAELARRERERARSLAEVAREDLHQVRAAGEEVRRAGLDVAFPAPAEWPGDDTETSSFLAYAAAAEAAAGAVRRAILDARHARRTELVQDALGTTMAASTA